LLAIIGVIILTNIKTKEIKLDNVSLKDAYELEENKSNTNTPQPEVEGGKYDAIIIIGIFVVLIGGFAALVVVGKK